ncbi:hypothetical protein PIB30_024530 [Stylosanthes scabra]|uniref:Uncharacterized protein n=1 Tax=Stylosanthes scabra TaxID=79078 RepID=A0ABU6Q9R8_9FABA|nr:hypothetical protein [Stylosanthes scabra]
MVGTRTTARDWQWLDEMMDVDAPAVRPTQRIRRMPEDYGRRRRGRGDRGRAEGGDTAPTQQSEGGASTSHAHHAGRSTQAWLDGLSSPGFQQMIDEILMPGDGGYRPEFDGTQLDDSQVHFDLNEPVFGPAQAFMALGGTPPSAAHVLGRFWVVPFMAPAIVSTPPALPAPAEQPDESTARRQCFDGGIGVAAVPNGDGEGYARAFGGGGDDETVVSGGRWMGRGGRSDESDRLGTLLHGYTIFGKVPYRVPDTPSVR